VNVIGNDRRPKHLEGFRQSREPAPLYRTAIDEAQELSICRDPEEEGHIVERKFNRHWCTVVHGFGIRFSEMPVNEESEVSMIAVFEEGTR
jgi:hypothetical protein